MKDKLKKSITEWIKKWNKKIFHNLEEINAEEAYNISMFGDNFNIEERIKQAILKINRLIKYKITLKDLSLIVDEEDDLIIESIIKYYKEKGYNVILLDSKLHQNIIGKHIFISWNKLK